MNVKRPLTIILLVFVAASAASMVLNEIRRQPASATLCRSGWDSSRPCLNEIRRQPASATPGRVQTSGGDPARKLIAYYLHGKIRCVTCNDIERSAKEAVEEGFGPELQAGRVEWRVVNYEEPGNEHYATDFKLVAPCVVLASMRDGRQVAWKTLPEVWELVGEKQDFRAFVQKNLREQLELGSLTLNTSASTARSVPVDTAAPAVTVGAKLPRLLDLGAGKCIPCKMMAPVLEELKQAYQGRLDVVFIDVWEDSAPAEKYGVSTIPTQIFLDAKGKELFRHEGFFSREEILAKWKELGLDLGTGGRS